MKNMEQMCQAFETMAIPIEASSMQRLLMRRSFYCGAKAILVLFDTMADMTDEDAECFINTIRQEVDQFKADSLSGVERERVMATVNAFTNRVTI